MMTRGKHILAVIFFILMLAITATVMFIWSELNKPYRAFSEDKLLVTIPSGISLDSASRLLTTKGVVRLSIGVERHFFTTTAPSRKMKAGEYVFDRAMTPFEIYKKLLRGEQQYRVLTVPEGTNTFDFAAILAKEGI